MWLATASKSAYLRNCANNNTPWCPELTAAKAFSFLSWIILTAYWILLLIFSAMAHVAGNHAIWRIGVRDADFTSSDVNATRATSRENLVDVEKNSMSETTTLRTKADGVHVICPVDRVIVGS
ncbi:hypothetical protein DL93DRAFT_786719 [Clavulina sp. PMI_390]|nr:hypothetical protein DL93DRAFT_786719 [Clavulina sp. PMI_390]